MTTTPQRSTTEVTKLRTVALDSATRAELSDVLAAWDEAKDGDDGNDAEYDAALGMADAIQGLLQRDSNDHTDAPADTRTVMITTGQPEPVEVPAYVGELVALMAHNGIALDDDSWNGADMVDVICQYLTGYGLTVE